MCNLNIMECVSFRTCIKPLRNVDHLTLDVPFSWTETFKNYFFLFLPLKIRDSSFLSIFRRNLISFYDDMFNTYEI